MTRARVSLIARLRKRNGRRARVNCYLGIIPTRNSAADDEKDRLRGPLF